jgi:hypothetical protein
MDSSKREASSPPKGGSENLPKRERLQAPEEEEEEKVEGEKFALAPAATLITGGGVAWKWCGHCHLHVLPRQE